jgi:glycerophosphoryl diester phosphodiesterase
LVHPWTFRAENNFLPQDMRRGSSPGAYGDLQGELLAYLRVGIDGFFTDQADQGLRARESFFGDAP